MATWVTSWASSQSRKAKSSAAVVPKVCTCSRVPFDPGTRTQAATVCLCTSSPHTRSISRSMVPPPRVVSPVPGGASFARLCSACSMATMRGADSSHVRLFADSRYQLQSTFPGIRRAVSIDDFHDARVCPRLMAIIFGLGANSIPFLAGPRSAKNDGDRHQQNPQVESERPVIDVLEIHPHPLVEVHCAPTARLPWSAQAGAHSEAPALDALDPAR